MSLTVNDIITKVNRHIGDDSNDRVTEADRLDAISEATAWLQEELGSDHQVETVDIEYSDASHYYLLDDLAPSFVSAADLRAEGENHHEPVTLKKASELAVEVSNNAPDNAYAIDRHDNSAYLIINYNTNKPVQRIADLSDTSDGGGTWTTTDDAKNLTADTTTYQEGSGSLRFEVDVSQSGSDRAGIENTSLDQLDLADLEDASSWYTYVYIPDTTNTSSVTFRWGSDSSNYWSVTETTNVNGQAIEDGWNYMRFDWSSATKTGTPDPSAVDFISIFISYSASQVDDTGYRIDGIKLAQREKLTLHFLSHYVGTDNSGNQIYSFSSTDDVPFFSDQYDKFSIAVGHKAAANLFRSPLRLTSQANEHDTLAANKLQTYSGIFPSHRRRETQQFKPGGINLTN